MGSWTVARARVHVLCRALVSWSAETIGGFVLAAAMADDAEASVARTAVAPEPGAQLGEAMRRFRDRPSAERRSELERLAATLRPTPAEDAPLPARARALLARDVSRSTGSRWLAEAPRPRRGFSAPVRLRDVLLRLAEVPTAEDPAVANRERGEGRRHLAEQIGRVPEQERASLLGALGEQEAGSVLSLEPLLGRDAPKAELELTRAFVRAALAMAPPAERSRALGAVAFGWAGERGGDRRSSGWRRCGWELRETTWRE